MKVIALVGEKESLGAGALTAMEALYSLLPLHSIAQLFEVSFSGGTMAHVGKASWLEEAIAADLDHVIPSSDGVFSWYHARFDAAGVKFDVAHHGKMGGVPWTAKNAGNRLAAETIWNYSANGWPLPDVVIRSHNHRSADPYDNFPVRVIYTPAWTFATEYIYRIGKYTANMLADVGGLVLTCEEGGLLNVTKDAYKPERRQLWKALLMKAAGLH